MTVSATKNERINLRLKQSAKNLIERAATFEGKTVSSFILSSALASAEKTIHEHESIQLNEQDAQRFFDALYRDCDALVETRALPERRVDFWPHDFYESKYFESFLKRHSGTNVYFGVATRDGDGGGLG